MSVLEIHRPLHAVVRRVRIGDGTIIGNKGLGLFEDEDEAQDYCDHLVAEGASDADLEIVSFAAQPQLAVAL